MTSVPKRTRQTSPLVDAAFPSSENIFLVRKQDEDFLKQGENKAKFWPSVSRGKTSGKRNAEIKTPIDLPTNLARAHPPLGIRDLKGINLS